MKAHDERLRNELVSRGLLTDDQSQKAAVETSKTKASFKDCVFRLGYAGEEDVLLAEADLLGVTYLDLEQYLIDEEILRLVPEKIARANMVMPVFKIGNNLTVATADPQNILSLDEVRGAANCEIDVVLAPKSTIKKTIDQYYGVGGTINDAAKSFEPIGGKGRARDGENQTLTIEDLGKAAEEAPVIKVVNLLIMKALDEKASDIHIEPEEDMLRVRNRVDGLLHEASQLPKKMQLAVASRVKIMAKLDIAETRKPQDGKIRLKIENRDLDIRVSTFPTTHGENIVMRLLEQSKLVLGLKELGFEPGMQRSFDMLIRKAYGMILVTGPTGAGKTTTLYSALTTINSMDKNIITIEDPVEYQIPLVRQTQVNVKAGLTFASGLRSILRQDPDVILVGEIRDTETADIAIQAALTGHLVFSTIHTNDASGAVARLLDMQIEPFLISSALIGVLAQRLVRTICPHCKEPQKVEPELLRKMGLPEDVTTYYRGKGCSRCKGTGYDRRVGIFELLPVDESVRRLIIARAGASEIKAAAMKAGMTAMRQDGILKAQKGVTTLEEVMKVTLEED